MGTAAQVGIGIVGLLVLWLLCGLRAVYQYQKGVLFTLGRLSGEMDPGLRLVLPIIQTWQRVDLRVRTIDVPGQECITKDNIQVHVNAVLYYAIQNAKLSVTQVQFPEYAVSQLAQTTMRNIVGEVELDQLLAERERLSERIRHIVDDFTAAWGIKVQKLELKDIVIPENMKRTIAKQAEAERERRSVIIRAEGEKLAAQDWAAAASELSAVPGGLHLRTLQAINTISSDQSNTVVFCVPLEVLRALESLAGKTLTQ